MLVYNVPFEYMFKCSKNKKEHVILTTTLNWSYDRHFCSQMKLFSIIACLSWM